MIRAEDLTIRNGAFELSGISFHVPAGGYCVLMGKTGSGKTTLLEVLCGLKPVVRGRILFGGVDVTHRRPAERNIGYVPQDAALFTTMTVREHLEFALAIRRVPRPEIDRRVEELAELLQIGRLLERRVHGLSGGEKQRVALGRALSFRPSILCLDEPLSALDDETREQMYRLLAHVRQQLAVTTIHVTHNQQEARRLADQVLWLHNGVLTERPPSDRRPEARDGGGAWSDGAGDPQAEPGTAVDDAAASPAANSPDGDQ